MKLFKKIKEKREEKKKRKWAASLLENYNDKIYKFADDCNKLYRFVDVNNNPIGPINVGYFKIIIIFPASATIYSKAYCKIKHQDGHIRSIDYNGLVSILANKEAYLVTDDVELATTLLMWSEDA